MNVSQVTSAIVLTASVLTATAANAGTLTTLYAFTGTSDAGYPGGALIYRKGALYGIANGAYETSSHGTAFKFDLATSTFQVLYTFKGGADGSGPSDLIIHGDTFYGATVSGGAGCKGSGCGTIFTLDPESGIESVLYNFPEPKNNLSASPTGLLYRNSTLYGISQSGGSFGHGSVFAFDLGTKTGTDLYSFTGGADGSNPGFNLLFIGGLLYGATQFGSGSCADGFCGTIFTVDPTTGAENTLHTFAVGIGGNTPHSNLIDHNGLIYGSTIYGGDLSCGNGGCGTVFSIDPASGAYNVVQTPATNHERIIGLAAHGNKLYETVLPPNGHRNLLNEGELASFNLSSGKRTLLYNFDHGRTGADGSQPDAPLVYDHGVFYGSTTAGGGTGCGNHGCGTLFKYVP